MSLRYEPSSEPLDISAKQLTASERTGNNLKGFEDFGRWGVGVGRNVKRLQGGLVFRAHRFLHHPTLGSRVIKKKKKHASIGS